MTEFAEHMDEAAQARRLDDALEALASGRNPGIDPREDPALDGLVQTAAVLQSLFAQATDTHAFESFHRRSRLAVIHRSETLQTTRALAARARAQTPAGPRMASVRAELVEGSRFNLTWLRRRLVPAFAPVAAAAAAAAVTFVALGGGAPGGSPELASSVIGSQQLGEPASAENRTPRTIDDQLARLQGTLATIAGAGERGEAVPAALLRQVTEDTASVQRQIGSATSAVSAETFASYAQTASQGQAVLSGVKAEPGGEGALDAAQLTADQAVVTAARFLAERSGDATPTATATETAAATSVPDGTATPEATGSEAAAPSETPADEPSDAPADAVAPADASPTASPAPAGPVRNDTTIE